MITFLAIFTYSIFEYWLGKTKKVKENSTIELILGVLSLMKKIK